MPPLELPMSPNSTKIYPEYRNLMKVVVFTTNLAWVVGVGRRCSVVSMKIMIAFGIFVLRGGASNLMVMAYNNPWY